MSDETTRTATMDRDIRLRRLQPGERGRAPIEIRTLSVRSVAIGPRRLVPVIRNPRFVFLGRPVRCKTHGDAECASLGVKRRTRTVTYRMELIGEADLYSTRRRLAEIRARRQG